MLFTLKASNDSTTFQAASTPMQPDQGSLKPIP